MNEHLFGYGQDHYVRNVLSEFYIYSYLMNVLDLRAYVQSLLHEGL